MPITRAALEKLREYFFDNMEGCDSDFLELASTVTSLIKNFNDVVVDRYNNLLGVPDSMQAKNAETINDRGVFATVCPFTHGYDYWKDVGIAAYMWQTTIATPTDILDCVEHYYRTQHQHGVNDAIDEFFNRISKLTSERYDPILPITFNIIISAASKAHVYNALQLLSNQMQLDTSTPTQASYTTECWYRSFYHEKQKK